MAALEENGRRMAETLFIAPRERRVQHAVKFEQRLKSPLSVVELDLDLAPFAVFSSGFSDSQRLDEVELPAAPSSGEVEVPLIIQEVVERGSGDLRNSSYGFRRPE